MKKIFIVESRSPKTNDRYLGKRPSDNELVIVEAGFNYDANMKYPVILAEISETDFSEAIELLEILKENGIVDMSTFDSNKLQSAINLLTQINQK